MDLKRWSAFLDKQRAKHDAAMAEWRAEYKKLCQIADFSFADDSDDWDYRSKIFEIQDAGARKALIAHNIKLLELTTKEVYYEVELNQYRVEKAKTEADAWWMLPSFITAMLCFASVGLEYFKIPATVGAIAAAACGLMMGLNYRDVRIREMREATKQARAKLSHAQENLKDCREHKAQFSNIEAETGQPSPQ